MRKSNDKLEEVYRFVKQYCLEHCYAPTYIEICEHLGMKSPSSTYFYIQKLLARGLLETDHDEGGAQRGYRLSGYELRPIESEDGKDNNDY